MLCLFLSHQRIYNNSICVTQTKNLKTHKESTITTWLSLKCLQLFLTHKNVQNLNMQIYIYFFLLFHNSLSQFSVFVHWKLQVFTSHICVGWSFDQDWLPDYMRRHKSYSHPLKIRLSMASESIYTVSNQCENSLRVLNCTCIILHCEAQISNCRNNRKKIHFHADSVC